MAQLSDVNELARFFIGDTDTASGDTFDDATLKPYINLAYRDVARWLRAGNVTLLTRIVPTFTVAIGTTRLWLERPRFSDFDGVGLNDTTWTGAHTSPIASYYEIEITTAGTPDVFRWRRNGGSWTTGVNVSTSAVALSHGLSIQWAASTGHTLGDIWTAHVLPLDFLRPRLVFAKAPATSRYGSQLRSERHGVGDVAPEAVVQRYAWIDNSIDLGTGASAAMDMRIAYEAQLPDLVNTTDYLLIPDSLDAVGKLAAAYALNSRDQGDDATFLLAAAKENVQAIIGSELNARIASPAVGGL